MLEIKTISTQNKMEFDMSVNTALREGWELTRRDCLVLGVDRQPYLYAEMERITVDYEEEDEYIGEPNEHAQWLVSRNPTKPFKCSSCGQPQEVQMKFCPVCGCAMEGADI